MNTFTLEATEDEKNQAYRIIEELRHRVHTLEAERDALKTSRDTHMYKVAEMQKQVNYWKWRVGKVQK